MKTTLFAAFIASMVAANGTQSSSPISTDHGAQSEKRIERSETLKREINKRLDILERKI